MRRTLTLILAALLLTSSMSISAFAAEETDPTTDTTTETTAPETEVPETETPETEVPDTTGQESETPEPESEAVQPESESDMISFAEGTIITLGSATKVREGMSTETDVVATLYKGEKVTVVMSYAEGWTKVTWKNKTGYIRSDLLQ